LDGGGAPPREALDGDGWLHTGDIGALRANGTLRVIDRKKNIFKLSQGEYVAPEKIEAVCTGSRFVAQAWVYGDSLQNCLVAVVVPHAEALSAWAAAQGLLEAGDVPALCRSAAAQRAVLHDLQTTAKAKRLATFEIPRAVHLEPTPFSVENDLLTPTFKLKRHEVRAKYRDVVAQLYAGLSGGR
jgi:long-chain acyl-CoA synthetase